MRSTHWFSIESKKTLSRLFQDDKLFKKYGVRESERVKRYSIVVSNVKCPLDSVIYHSFVHQLSKQKVNLKEMLKTAKLIS